MEETIKIIQHFTDGQLYDSCCSLLHHLKVSFSEVTAEPVPFVQLYPGFMPKGLQSIVEKVDATYYIGQVDSETLSGGSKAKTIEEVEKLTSQGKYEGMMIFAVDIQGGQHITRSEMASLTRGFNRIASAQPVILFIRHGNLLSLATCERMEYTQQWRNGEKLGKVSILRDINCCKPHHGHIDILEQLGDKSYTTFDELYRHWMDVFSSELLTKKFYGELSDWYAWAIKVARFPNDITSDNVDKPMNDIAVIRLITRLIFVWFLYCKRLIPKEFFDIGYIHDHLLENFTPDGRQPLLYDPEKSRYYRAILQNLFFAMLNRPIVADGKDKANNRQFMPRQTYHGMNAGYNVNNLMRYEKDFIDGGADEFLQLANSRVPFLNGGLFDCLDDKPNNKYFDGFSERKESLAKLHVPDYLFFGGTADADLSEWYGDKRKKHIRVEGIIDIFKRYYFTVEENTPLDQEVSLDPELLGKSFENLLAAYVPETGTNARKQTGSFYTPRDEVQYMVVESLVAHLTRICGAENENTYRSLLSYSEEEVKMTDELRMNIMLALYNCRILDPACGSGAFPMGMLQMMVHVLRRIDPANSMWRSLMIDQATIQAKQAFGTNDEQERQERLADIENAFNRSVNDPDYARKLYLIEHCIYGVDIQPIAIQISKLRFFISLIVDQHPTENAAENFGIRPLPNLEANFVAANTLIPVNYDSTFVDTIPEVVRYKKELKELNHKVFLAGRNHKKEQLKDKIHEVRDALAKAIENSGFVQPGVASLLASWDMFDQNASASFFDPEWMFGIKGGFDIIIANPPYVLVQNIKDKILQKEYRDKNIFSVASYKVDLYHLFIEKGLSLLCKGGDLCYITPSNFLTNNYTLDLRNLLLKKNSVISVINIADEVFEANVNNCIINVSKVAPSYNTILTYYTGNITNQHLKVTKLSSNKQEDYLKEIGSIIQPMSNGMTQTILKKIRVLGQPLKFFATVKFGMQLRNRKLYPMDVLKNPAESELSIYHRRCLTGKDIIPYSSHYNNLYCYFNQEAKCGGCWDESIHNHKVKVLIRQVGSIPVCGIDTNGYAVLNSAFMIVCTKIDPYSVLGLINSKLIQFYWSQVFEDKRKTFPKIKGTYIEQIPIVLPQNDKIAKVAKDISERKGKDVKANTFEQETLIDIAVFHLYGLSYDEVLVVDPDTPITREEYEKKEEI